LSAFNTVHSQQVCPTCHNLVELVIQFKYGDVWQHVYHIGDRLRWDRNNYGEPGHMRVVLDAVAEPCPICAANGHDYEVYIEADNIASVRPASGAYDFAACGESYIVLDL
jgi:hypothetical protein